MLDQRKADDTLTSSATYTGTQRWTDTVPRPWIVGAEWLVGALSVRGERAYGSPSHPEKWPNGSSTGPLFWFYEPTSLGVSPRLKESLTVFSSIARPAPGKQSVPGSGLCVTKPQFPEVSGAASEAQGTSDYVGNGVTLIVVEFFKKTEHAAGDTRLVPIDQAVEERATSVGRIDVQGGITSRQPQRRPELPPFRGAWERQRSEKIDQMAIGCLVVGDVARRCGSDFRDMLGVQLSTLWPVEWTVQLVGEVLGQLVILIQIQPNDHKCPHFNAR
ncbi:hypothetical protein ACGFXB_27530 [Streptomyces canus]|uniref:hypothetical protein n=1 Tax=Streptomyces canus TaxID=58343 RepID=UPI0037184242